ncbi:sensor histidine kinase, partial [Streptomyces sp. NPDC002120]|uniref:sensor histidine kinase n=1 Tax=Streptomyces sp. NPDC002120 TaxID=3364631 RepID=UPI003682CD81
GAHTAPTVHLRADTLPRGGRPARASAAPAPPAPPPPGGGRGAAADLLPRGETEDLLRARVRDLRGLVEDLLEISRLDAGAERPVRDRVPLGAVVSEAVVRTGLDTEIVVTADADADADADPRGSGTAPAGVTVETDPRRLERIVGNLVVNAHRHGDTPVRVTVQGRTVVVRDHGPGFPRDLLVDGPRRFHTGAAGRGTGHGLGLTIALGQARLLGAELRFENAPDGGAVATLRLPA